MAEFSENRHISNLINMSCKVTSRNLDNEIAGFPRVSNFYQ